MIVALVFAPIFALVFAPIFASVATAQDLDLYYSDDTVQIVSVKKSKVCYATFNLVSAKGDAAFFSTYRLKDGDRWQVAGYRGDGDTPDSAPARKDDIVTITFDDAPFMVRGFEWDRAAFFLPFTDKTELRDYDKRVADSARMELKLLRKDDVIPLDLANLRAVRQQIASCVDGL